VPRWGANELDPYPFPDLPAGRFESVLFSSLLRKEQAWLDEVNRDAVQALGRQSIRIRKR
tara:strand:+ start:5849 stop:6028 length:180 start_codon:yes stop_codon:yes gene_type:complete